MSVPGDVSVVSFDEDECLAFLEVPVTSVCMPLAELGAAAVDALIARIEGRSGRSDVLVREPDVPGPARFGGSRRREASVAPRSHRRPNAQRSAHDGTH